jgi:hypothetical protein
VEAFHSKSLKKKTAKTLMEYVEICSNINKVLLKIGMAEYFNLLTVLSKILIQKI